MITDEQKRERKYNLLGTGAIIVLFGFTAYMITSVMVPKAMKEEKAKAQKVVIDNKVKRYEQTLPYYKEYLQTKKQIAHYRDSLERAVK